MKNLHKMFFFLGILTLVSCGSDDDICTSGEATPRMKVKFKSSAGKEKTIDSLYISADYGAGKKSLATIANADSVLIPLRVDDAASTDLYFKTSKKGNEAKLKVGYSQTSIYVSPACGIKRLYHDVSYSLETPDPVKKIEAKNTEIINESKTHLYLIF